MKYLLFFVESTDQVSIFLENSCHVQRKRWITSRIKTKKTCKTATCKFAHFLSFNGKTYIFGSDEKIPWQ